MVKGIHEICASIDALSRSVLQFPKALSRGPACCEPLLQQDGRDDPARTRQENLPGELKYTQLGGVIPLRPPICECAAGVPQGYPITDVYMRSIPCDSLGGSPHMPRLERSPKLYDETPKTVHAQFDSIINP